MSSLKSLLFVILPFLLSAGSVLAKEEIDRGLPEWLEVQTKIQVLRTKIKAKEDIVKKLIADKQSAKDEAAARVLVEQLKSEYKEMVQSIDEYEQLRGLLKYRYPEKGHKGERQYERLEARPLDEMERQMSIEGRVRHTLGRIRQQYPDTPQAPTTKAVVKTPSEAAGPLAPRELTESEKRVTEPSAVQK